MIRFLLDTDHVSLHERGHAALQAHLAAHPPDEIGVSAVTAEESLRGRLAILSRRLSSAERLRAYSNFLAALQFFASVPVVPFDQACEDEFQKLLAAKLRVGTQDLKIAATALAHGLTLVTRNRKDFQRVPGLVLDDWSV
jgi:tRNA(fMet)-specific endonuclease VapC